MASTEEMRAGVRIAVAFLNDVAILLHKGEEKEDVCVRQWIMKSL
jgi:hypothetical protein